MSVLGEELAVEVLALERPAEGDREHFPLAGRDLGGFEEIHGCGLLGGEQEECEVVVVVTVGS
jgi:hypothetical protein